LGEPEHDAKGIEIDVFGSDDAHSGDDEDGLTVRQEQHTYGDPEQQPGDAHSGINEDESAAIAVIIFFFFVFLLDFVIRLFFDLIALLTISASK